MLRAMIRNGGSFWLHRPRQFRGQTATLNLNTHGLTKDTLLTSCGMYYSAERQAIVIETYLLLDVENEAWAHMDPEIRIGLQGGSTIRRIGIQGEPQIVGEWETGVNEHFIQYCFNFIDRFCHNPENEVIIIGDPELPILQITFILKHASSDCKEDEVFRKICKALNGRSI